MKPEVCVTKRPEFAPLEMIDVDGIPQSFRWHGHRYVVQRIVMQWIEIGPWWQSFANTFYQREFADVDAADVTWYIWRIEAQSMAGTVIADVAQRFSVFSAAADPWRLIRVMD